MLVGLISDSHDHVKHTEQAVSLFNDREVELVLHAGDFCSPFMVPPFEGLNLKAVFGNNDGDHYMLLDKFQTIEGEHLGTFGDIEIEGKRIGLYHGTDTPITSALEQCKHYDIIVSGHTHQKKVEKFDNTLSINPGTAHGFDEEATIAFLDTETMDVEFSELT